MPAAAGSGIGSAAALGPTAGTAAILASAQQSSTPAAAIASGPVGAEARENSAARQQQVVNAELATQSTRLQRGEVIHESLQGLVRHQLELLAAPILRWEGDVWSGIFMALMVQPPNRRDERGASDEEEPRQDDSGTNEWQSSMTLQVAGLGEVGVKLWLGETRLELELAASDPDVRLALAEGVEQLKSRLEALDLDEVLIRLHHDLPAVEQPR